MKTTLFSLLIVMLSLMSGTLVAQDETETLPDSINMEEMMQEFAKVQAIYDSINNSFRYDSGRVNIGDGIAELNLPPGYRFLDQEQAQYLITEIWGNPSAEGTIGMLFTTGNAPMGSTSWGVDISYEEDGYVDDEDANDIDYNDLLEEMQGDTEAANEYREENGYEPVSLVGWAAKPYYDFENKKLHWAKELKFGEAEVNTLNYNIRILGRKGVLVLNAIGDMDALEDVESQIKPIVNAVDFTEGNRYADFDPSIDKVAAVGIGGLIAGKVLAKAGFFALLAKFWKLIAVGAVAVFAGIRRFFGGGKSEEETEEA